jgi:hypothetical protein
MHLLAWMPFVQPMPGALQWWWAWVVPIVVLVSVTWKAIRLTSLERYWREVGWMSGQILLGMLALAVGLIALVQWVVPLLPAD